VAQVDPEEQPPDVLTSTAAGNAGDSALSSSTDGPSGNKADRPSSGQVEPVDDDSYVEDLEFDGVEDGDPVETVDELGRRHVRRAAPEGTEQILENEAPRETGLPDNFERWRQRSATGAVLTAFAFGLQQVFEPERKQPAIIMQTSGDPPKDLPVEAQLEQLGPRQSSVTVRSWLLANGDPADETADVADDQAVAPNQATGEDEAGAQ
jgi:hypothetical protein